MKASATLAEHIRPPAMSPIGAMQHVAVRPLADHATQAGVSALAHDFSQVSARPESAAPAVTVCQLSLGGVYHACPLPVQTKLATNEPGDEYEREADRISESLIKIPAAPEYRFRRIGKPIFQMQEATAVPKSASEQHHSLSSSDGERIIQEGEKWTGTPYSYAGDTKDGIDCSHFVHKAYVEAGFRYVYLNTHLFPTSPSFVQVDAPQIGDVVLFSGHMGLYNPNPPEKGKTILSAGTTQGVGYGKPGWYSGIPKNYRYTKTPSEEKEPTRAQLKRYSGRNDEGPRGMDETKIGAAPSGGQKLPDTLGAFFEARLGHDFSHVRIHTGIQASEAARDLNARAFTVGRDIVFGEGQYAPDTLPGKRLLAHELVHVVQQAHGVSPVVRKSDESAGSVQVVESTNANIEALDLAPAARKAAYELIKKHPGIVFTSGRRCITDQARIMAANIVKSSDRNWIRKTYSNTSSRRKLQEWVDKHAEATTVDALTKGLEGVLNTLSEKQRSYISKHLTGEAFDVQPVTENADTIKNDIRALPGIKKFLEREAGLIRWHAQFKRAPAKPHAIDEQEKEADRIAEHAIRLPSRQLQRQMKEENKFDEPSSLIECLDPGTLTDAEKAVEINLIQEWLSANPGHPDNPILEKALISLRPDAKICGPDVTEWLIRQMETNGRSEIVAEMRESNEGASFLDHGLFALGKWYSLVRTGGPWDFKTQLGETISGITPCRRNCKGKLWSITLDGHCMTYEAAANIHYGYVGRLAGFSEARLLGGASGAQVLEGRGETADAPRDVQAIRKGFELFKSGSPRGLSRDGLDRNFYQNLGPEEGDPEGCEPCPSKL